MTVSTAHTAKPLPPNTPASDAEAERRFIAMKALAVTLVRRVKDEATEDAILMLTSHLLNVQLQAEQKTVEDIKRVLLREDIRKDQEA
jgi:hypothetical protein